MTVIRKTSVHCPFGSCHALESGGCAGVLTAVMSVGEDWHG